MGRGMADHAQAFGRIGVHGVMSVHWAGTVAERSHKVSVPSAVTRSHHGFEFFAAQRFLQNSGHITLFGGVHHLSFHADIHAYTPSGALVGRMVQKKEWGG